MASSPIRPGNSLPVNPAAPSLVTLPVELRNAIFEEFCIAPGVFVLEKPRHPADTECNNTPAIKKGMPDICVLPLLQSCRQIYYEVSAMFYQGNHFRVVEFDIKHHHGHVQALMHSVGLWLQQLGSQLSLLRYVSISTDLYCQLCRRQSSWKFLPLLSIVKAFWMQKETLDLQVLIETHPDQRPRVLFLNSVIQSLVADTDLALCRAKNLILDIHLGPKFRFNQVYWKGSGCQKYMGAQKFVTFFNISNAGRLSHHQDREILRLIGTPFSSRTLRKPRCTPALEEYFWRSIIISKDPVVFDLDSKSHTGSGFVALQNISQLRKNKRWLSSKSWYLRYWEENRFQVRILADKPHSNSDPFEQLRVWLCLERSKNYPWACRLWKWSGGLSIILRAKVSHHSERANIRISIMEIIRITSHVRSDNVDIRLAVVSRHHGEDCEQFGPSISLNLLRQRALQALSEISWQEPGREPLSHACPDLLINGFGQVVEAVWSSERVTLDYLDHPQPGTEALDDWYILGYDDESSPCRTVEVAIQLSRNVKVTRDSERQKVIQHYDGSLENHLKYLRSVLRWTEYPADRWAGACESNQTVYYFEITTDNQI